MDIYYKVLNFDHRPTCLQIYSNPGILQKLGKQFHKLKNYKQPGLCLFVEGTVSSTDVEQDFQNQCGAVISMSGGVGNKVQTSSETLKHCPWLLWLGLLELEMGRPLFLSHYPLLRLLALT